MIPVSIHLANGTIEEDERLCRSCYSGDESTVATETCSNSFSSSTDGFDRLEERNMSTSQDEDDDDDDEGALRSFRNSTDQSLLSKDKDEVMHLCPLLQNSVGKSVSQSLLSAEIQRNNNTKVVMTSGTEPAKERTHRRRLSEARSPSFSNLFQEESSLPNQSSTKEDREEPQHRHESQSVNPSPTSVVEVMKATCIRKKLFHKLGIASDHKQKLEQQVQKKQPYVSSRPHQALQLPLKADHGKVDRELIQILSTQQILKLPKPTEPTFASLLGFESPRMPVLQCTSNSLEDNESLQRVCVVTPNTSSKRSAVVRSPRANPEKTAGVSIMMKHSLSPSSLTSVSLSASQASSHSCGSSSSRRSTSPAISFNAVVQVRTIPDRSMYSKRIANVLWTSPLEMQQNVARNTYEFAAEQWDWQLVADDDEMYVCPTSGEKIHPIHFMSHKYNNNNNYD